MSSKRTAAALVTAALLVCPLARAGGIDELPDHGAQALGRGATFTAKADDASALYYNVAGIARQRGTKLQISANLHFNTFYFARAGRYPDDPANPETPWGGQPFPVVRDQNTSVMIPMVAMTTDLGIFDRLTFGAGIFAPAATGRTFPLGVRGMPSPARYDFVQSNGAVFYPTLGAAYRVTKQLDIGVAGHLVVASLDELSVAYADPGGGSCKNAEYVKCDGEGRVEASGLGGAASVGVLARPYPWLQIGAQLKTPSSVTANGKVKTKLGGADLPETTASVTLDMPWVARVGARYIGMDGKFEKYDLELNGTYEAWGAAQGTGPTAVTGDLTGSGAPTTITIVHKWHDTFSVRGGGAYNIPVPSFSEDTVLSLRAGAFYDSSATDSAYTRLDFNTLAKVAGTLGAGIKTGAFTFNVAYAAVASIDRSVRDGDIRPSNGAKEGRFVDGEDRPLPAVNNGDYKSCSHVVSLGVEIAFDKLGRSERKVTFGDPAYEKVDGAPGPARPEDDDEAKKKLPRSPDAEPAIAASEAEPAPAAAPATATPAPEAVTAGAAEAENAAPATPDGAWWLRPKTDETTTVTTTTTTGAKKNGRAKGRAGRGRHRP
jgi:long-chain fatty acid transport protein